MANPELPEGYKLVDSGGPELPDGYQLVAPSGQGGTLPNGLPMLHASDVQGLTNVRPEQIIENNKKAPTSAGAAALYGAMQGAPLEFGDEIEAGIRALAHKFGVPHSPYVDTIKDALTGSDSSLGGLYNQSLQDVRARNAQAAADQPAAFYGANLASSLLTPLGPEGLGLKAAARGAVKAPLLNRIGAGALEGGAYGAGLGAGAAEGNENIAPGAATGALGGGLLGGLSVPAIDLLANVGGKIATPIKAAFAPQATGKEKFAEALARDVGRSGSMGGVRAGMNRIDARLNAAQRAPNASNMMLGDFGGESTQNLMRAAYNMPTDEAQRIKRAVDFRQGGAGSGAGGQAARIERDLAAAMGTKENFYAATDDLAKRMEAAGNNAIQPALQIPTPMSPRLNSVLKRPTMEKVMDRVKTALADEGRPIGLINRTEQLHRAKIEIDELLGDAVKARKMGNTPSAGFDVRTLTTLKHDLLNAIDNPDYKAGLRMFATEAQLKRTAETWHEDFFKMAPEEMTKALAQMSAPEQRMARLGATRAIAEKIRAGNVNRDRTENIFGSPDMYYRLKAVMPDNAARRQFQVAVRNEAKMADTRKALQGGPTTAKQLMQAQEAGEIPRAISAIGNVKAGRLEPLLAMIARVGNRFSGITPATANIILKTAQQKGLGDMRPQLLQAMLKAERSPARRAALAKAFAIGGVSAGEAPSRQ